MNSYITKNSRVTATYLTARPGCLAGAQVKVVAREVVVTGVVRHVRGDHPTHPTSVRVYLDPDPGQDVGELTRPPGCNCSTGHLEVDLNHVTAVEGTGTKR